jgi:hypothetical protein
MSALLRRVIKAITRERETGQLLIRLRGCTEACRSSLSAAVNSVIIRLRLRHYSSAVNLKFLSYCRKFV